MTQHCRERCTRANPKPVLLACEVTANNQGYPISPVAKRRRLLTGLTLSASKGVPPCSQLQTCTRFGRMLFWRECFVGEGKFCAPVPSPHPTRTLLYLPSAGQPNLRRRKKKMAGVSCDHVKLIKWTYNKGKDPQNTNWLFGPLWTRQQLLFINALICVIQHRSKQQGESNCQRMRKYFFEPSAITDITSSRWLINCRQRLCEDEGIKHGEGNHERPSHPGFKRTNGTAPKSKSPAVDFVTG